MDLQSGKQFLYSSVTNVTGGVYTLPISGMSIYAESEGVQILGSTVSQCTGSSNMYKMLVNIPPGTYGVELIAPNSIVYPPVIQGNATVYGVDPIYERFLQSASVPNRNSSFSTGSWYAVAGFDDVEYQFIVNPPTTAYGGNGSDLTGYSFSCWAPNISGGAVIGTVSVISVSGCELQLNIPHANLPISLVSGASSNYTVDIRGTSGTGKQVTVYKLTLYLTTS